MYHILFIHSSVNGHLGCFLVLPIVNSVVMNTEVCVSFWIMFCSGHMPRSRIAKLQVGLVLVFFLGTSILFSTVARVIYFFAFCFQCLEWSSSLD